MNGPCSAKGRIAFSTHVSVDLPASVDQPL
jgi:hypothetical protein